eukprot:1395982-Prorocentrum_lima.AAC.1
MKVSRERRVIKKGKTDLDHPRPTERVLVMLSVGTDVLRATSVTEDIAHSLETGPPREILGRHG